MDHLSASQMNLYLLCSLKYQGDCAILGNLA
jgi:hypothetical protein